MHLWCCRGLQDNSATPDNAPVSLSASVEESGWPINTRRTKGNCGGSDFWTPTIGDAYLLDNSCWLIRGIGAQPIGGAGITDLSKRGVRSPSQKRPERLSFFFHCAAPFVDIAAVFRGRFIEEHVEVIMRRAARGGFDEGWINHGGWYKPLMRGPPCTSIWLLTCLLYH